MNWQQSKHYWPFAHYSQFTLQKPHLWHIQDIGTGPVILLIHGAGSTTHSWQHLVPFLTDKYRVIMVDLPGQGFTRLGAQQRCGLDHMAEDLTGCLTALDIAPTVIIGHSAGAAIALRLAELATFDCKVIGINAALDHFRGVAGVLFPLLAKAIANLPFSSSVLSKIAGHEDTVDRILKGTGSDLVEADLKFYKELMRSRSHIGATMQMMSQWDLEPLLARLPNLQTETHLIASSNDLAVPCATSQRAAALLPNADYRVLSDLGHLAHEEDAATIAACIVPLLDFGSASVNKAGWDGQSRSRPPVST
jgi:magnesium chelatase accessory protein